MTEVFRATGLSKVYPPSHAALDAVDFGLRAGEVHALVGENGAGKSTLSALIAGLRTPTGGTMALKGRPYSPRNRREAESLGVRIVTQELNLVGTLTVAESLSLERLPNRFGVIDRRRLVASAREALERVGIVDLDPNTKIESLGIGQRQMIEIAAGLSHDCELLILDEPTAALTANESEALFQQIGLLREKGIAIVYISHHLDEVRRLADRVTVLRDGTKIGTFERPTEDEMVRAMVGRDLDTVSHASFATDRELLRVERVRECSFVLHEGEVLGIAGLMGAGRTELLRAVFGADPKERGKPARTATVTLDGRIVAATSPKAAVAAGIGLLTEDRKEQGLFLPLSIRENASIARLRNLARLGVVRQGQERHEAERLKDALGIRCHTVEQPVSDLSGGNQQKVVIAKWLARDCKVLLFDEPTRGIDVGAKFEIYALIADLAKQGKGIVVVSSEMNELLKVCDRILVMSAGRLVDDVPRADFDQDRIMRAALSGYGATV